MKRTIIFLLVAGGVAWQAAAADLTAKTSAQTKVQARTTVPLLQLAHPKADFSDKIDRVGNLSSRPWSEIAGRPAAPSFVDQREYVDQPNFALVRISLAPR
jgi:hypothetical protein